MKNFIIHSGRIIGDLIAVILSYQNIVFIVNCTLSKYETGRHSAHNSLMIVIAVRVFPCYLICMKDSGKMIARDVMDSRFHCIRPDNTIAEAVRLFKTASDAEEKKIFGMMVTDAEDRLVGMLSMFDILLFIQPKHVKIWGEMEDLDPGPLFESLLDRVKNIRVEDIMTTDLVTIKPDTHLLVIVDIMITKHIRRLPIVEGGRVIGILYRSNVFYYLLRKFIE